MARVRLASQLQPLAGGAQVVDADGATLRAVLDDLARRFPAIAGRIIEDGMLRPDVMVAVGADETRDLNAPVPADAEVHILPAIAGG
jgi:molybdopterin converting factor small subunit